MKRYFLYSGGLASISLGLAVIVSFLAVSYTTEATPNGDVAEEPPPVVSKAPIVLQYSQVSSTRTELQSVFFQPTPTPEPLPAPLPAEPAPQPPAAPAGPAPAAQAPAAPPPSDLPVTGVLENVNITFYDCASQGFCGTMYNGEQVYEGAAACSWNLPIGTAFYILGDPTGRIYICKDRGLLTDTWVDIFWYYPEDGYAWQSMVGRYGTIAIVSLN